MKNTTETRRPKKRLLRKILLIGFALAALAITVGATYVGTYRPAQRPALELQVERTADRVERGRYLVENVTGCVQCHSDRDWTLYGGPAKKETWLGGGECATEEQGFPGVLCVPNLTPDDETGLGRWSDGEILRALREGVDRDGRALFPMMPYDDYRHLSDRDAAAIVAYLRTLEPVFNPRPETDIEFPVSFFIKTIPEPLAGPVEAPGPADTVRHGELLAKVAGCEFCHTPIDERHQPLPGMAFAGRPNPRGPFGTVHAPNLTPHATGMGSRSREEFIGIFKAFSSADNAAIEVEPQDNTPMPWADFAQMTEGDLGAIYDYLRTVAPVDNPVVVR
ncbi:MAG: cytochrome c [bacterium]|nr:cytochrome c [bacterium]